VKILVKPSTCPARAAASFWEKEALQQSSGMGELGGIHWGLAMSLTLAWVLVYFIIFKGVQSSGKVVYVTAILPYVALVIFFFRAVTLPGAGVGVAYYLTPKLDVILTAEVWIRAATQIFYSLGVGFGSLIAFASYSSKSTDFVKQSGQVACINCGTSFFAGFVVFPILGFLCTEMSQVNPCIEGNDLKDLSSIGLSGTGLAFIAFPIAIDAMAWGKFFWAMLFFVMLFCLGIDSQFAMVESVMTVLHDAKVGHTLPKSTVCAIVCGISWLIGLIFCTKAGIYWFNLFDYYTCVVAMFVVTIMECLGVAWFKRGLFSEYVAKVKTFTGRELGLVWWIAYAVICPVCILVLLFLALGTFDIMGAKKSVAFPEGTGFLPTWSIFVGWFLGLLPVAGLGLGCFLGAPEEEKSSTSNAAVELMTNSS
jgi:SNF family Na+-dependent transporter